ncbi:MAG: hypothetical protein HY683_02660 [Chloroflexi bacterium]|nr:hypothetical protein [Chloroflexota bacterium]
MPEEVFAQCLDRMAQGATAEECLALFPEWAQELAPLLHTARTISASAEGLKLRPEARAAVLARVLAAHRERQVHRARPRLAWLSRPLVLAPALSVLVLALVAWGTATASGGTVPGDPLYPVKLTRERVVLVLARAPEDKARVYARITMDRAWEMEVLARQGADRGRLEHLAQELRANGRRYAVAVALQGLASAPGPGPGANLAQTEQEKSRDNGAAAPVATASPAPMPPQDPRQERMRREMWRMFKERSEEHERALQETMMRAPPGYRQQLEQALQTSQQGFQAALAALRQGVAPPEDEGQP